MGAAIRRQRSTGIDALCRVHRLLLVLALLALVPAASAAQTLDPDLNDDGVVDILDVSLVSSCVTQDPTTTTRCAAADVDHDGDVDRDDVRQVVEHLGETSDPDPPDVLPPVVTAPVGITVPARDATGIPATDPAIQEFLNAASALDETDGPITPVPDAPAQFPLGTTPVTFSATDTAGNTGIASSPGVTVLDLTEPVVTAPANVTVPADDENGLPASHPAIAAFLAGATAVDNVDGPILPTHDAPVLFVVGDTLVSFTAVDAAGNVGGDTARITVTLDEPVPSPVVVTITSPAPGLVGGTPVTVTGTVDAATANVTVNGVGASQGDGHFDGLPSLTVAADDDGRAQATLTLSEEVGVNAHVVEASFVGLQGLPATYVASAVVPGLVSATTVSGIVLDNADLPIPGATASIVGTVLQAITDDNGQFVLSGAPVGTVHLVVDGSTSTRAEVFPSLEFELVTISGRDNTIGMPVLIPAIDTGGALIVGGGQDVTLTMADVPGLELTVFANSVTFADGSTEGEVSITQVHLDDLPMPPPNGQIFTPAWTIQPAGTHFDPPARISIPNTGGLPPGQQTEIFQFDHDLEEFLSVGVGTVTADGSRVMSDLGFGITKAGWGGCGSPAPPPVGAAGRQSGACGPNGIDPEQWGFRGQNCLQCAFACPYCVQARLLKKILDCELRGGFGTGICVNNAKNEAAFLVVSCP